MQTTAYNHPLYRNFVRPELCAMLSQYGLSQDTTHKWKCRNREIILYTHVFDVDQYYVDSTKMIDEINAPVRVTAAYSAADMILIFAELGINWSLNNENGKFFFGQQPGSPYRDVHINSCCTRFPDLFAEALLKLLDRRRVNLTLVNKVFSLSNYTTCVS